MAQQKGWDATGKLLPLWNRLPGQAKREALAAASGVSGTELSAHNNGKPLGRVVAQKIIDGFAKLEMPISNLELGAPLEEADAEGKTLRDLLQALQATVAANKKTIDSHTNSIRALQSRVRALERSAVTSQPAHGGR